MPQLVVEEAPKHIRVVAPTHEDDVEAILISFLSAFITLEHGTFLGCMCSRYETGSDCYLTCLVSQRIRFQFIVTARFPATRASLMARTPLSATKPFYSAPHRPIVMKGMCGRKRNLGFTRREALRDVAATVFRMRDDNTLARNDHVDRRDFEAKQPFDLSPHAYLFQLVHSEYVTKFDLLETEDRGFASVWLHTQACIAVVWTRWWLVSHD